ncbi:hypothetical protein CG471_11815 [Sphingobium sp. IP1]|uniref:hypothetical protein n=1 Tax=Sphingobium sp. IP1 TaxID=2021637 RepID=UPI000C07B8BA|nr:hypothetical protein [Sphingobium sp. IP1]PHP19539.1 hypothetical protein CG471_11815 [Sphingobium sp. IP1]
MRAPRTDYAAFAAGRGHVVLYRPGQPNHCPGCGASQWLVGRATAECGRCATAIPIISPAVPGIFTEGQN